MFYCLYLHAYITKQNCFLQTLLFQRRAYSCVSAIFEYDLDPESFHDLSGVKPECWASETFICSILMTLSQTIIS